MSKRSSAFLWLAAGAVCGLVSLASCGGAGFAIYHVEDSLKDLDRQIAEDKKAQDDPKNRADKKQNEIVARINKNLDHQDNYGRYRYFSIAGAVLALIPSFLTLVFLGMGLLGLKEKPPKKQAKEPEFVEDEESSE